MRRGSPVRAGAMRDRVELQRKTSQTGYVKEGAAWTTVDTVAARITPVAARSGEIEIGGTVRQRTRYNIRVRAGSEIAGIDPSWRVVDTRSGQTYAIIDVQNPDERDRVLLLVCHKGTPAEAA